MFNMQHLVDGMSKQWQDERALTQMTLGTLIDRLKAMPPEALIDGMRAPHSYRGYYSDLAFTATGQKMTVQDALVLCKDAMGEVFEGYKGGDFQMGRKTPVWIAEYGHCGMKIISLRDDGVLVLGEDE